MVVATRSRAAKKISISNAGVASRSAADKGLNSHATAACIAYAFRREADRARIDEISRQAEQLLGGDDPAGTNDADALLQRLAALQLEPSSLSAFDDAVAAAPVLHPHQDGTTGIGDRAHHSDGATVVRGHDGTHGGVRQVAEASAIALPDERPSSMPTRAAIARSVGQVLTPQAGGASLPPGQVDARLRDVLAARHPTVAAASSVPLPDDGDSTASTVPPAPPSPATPLTLRRSSRWNAAATSTPGRPAPSPALARGGGTAATPFVFTCKAIDPADSSSSADGAQHGPSSSTLRQSPVFSFNVQPPHAASSPMSLWPPLPLTTPPPFSTTTPPPLPLSPPPAMSEPSVPPQPPLPLVSPPPLPLSPYVACDAATSSETGRQPADVTSIDLSNPQRAAAADIVCVDLYSPTPSPQPLPRVPPQLPANLRCNTAQEAAAALPTFSPLSARWSDAQVTRVYAQSGFGSFKQALPASERAAVLTSETFSDSASGAGEGLAGADGVEDPEFIPMIMMTQMAPFVSQCSGSRARDSPLQWPLRNRSRSDVQTHPADEARDGMASAVCAQSDVAAASRASAQQASPQKRTPQVTATAAAAGGAAATMKMNPAEQSHSAPGSIKDGSGVSTTAPVPKQAGRSKKDNSSFKNDARGSSGVAAATSKQDAHSDSTAPVCRVEVSIKSAATAPKQDARSTSTAPAPKKDARRKSPARHEHRSRSPEPAVRHEYRNESSVPATRHEYSEAPVSAMRYDYRSQSSAPAPTYEYRSESYAPATASVDTCMASHQRIAGGYSVSTTAPATTGSHWPAPYSYAQHPASSGGAGYVVPVHAANSYAQSPAAHAVPSYAQPHAGRSSYAVAVPAPCPGAGVGGGPAPTGAAPKSAWTSGAGVGGWNSPAGAAPKSAWTGSAAAATPAGRGWSSPAGWQSVAGVVGPPGAAGSWSGVSEPQREWHLVLFDTNVWLHYAAQIVQWVEKVVRLQTVQLLIPNALIRELDGVKYKPGVGIQAVKASKIIEELSRSSRAFLRYQRDHESISSPMVQFLKQQVQTLFAKKHMTKYDYAEASRLAREFARMETGDDSFLACLRYFRPARGGGGDNGGEEDEIPGLGVTSLKLYSHDRNLRILGDMTDIIVYDIEDLKRHLAAPDGQPPPQQQYTPLRHAVPCGTAERLGDSRQYSCRY